MEKDNSRDPKAHTTKIKKEFRVLIDHLREDVEKVDDCSAKALFETSAEVLSGLEKAFNDFEAKKEPAWK